MIHDHPERSLYDTFLELQGACQLLRLGRTAEAAAAMPDRVPGDAITSTGTFYAAMRASLALLRGEDDAARARARRAAPVRAGQPAPAVGRGAGDDDRSSSPSARAGSRTRARPRPAASREIEGTEEGGRLVKLLWAALMVEAEAAERSRATFDDETARDAARAARERASRGPGSGPRARATPRWPRRS